MPSLTALLSPEVSTFLLDMPSEAKLTSLTTSTLSLLLERQRLQSTHPTLHLVQIVTNLRTLRSGVIALQDTTTTNEHEEDSVAALRGQYERLRGMLGEEEADKAGLERYAAFSLSATELTLHSIPLPASPSPTPPGTPERKSSFEPASVFEPYTDDPPMDDDGIVLQQRQIIQGSSSFFSRLNGFSDTRADQDAHLDHLSSSIHRQHHISLQINDELDVHTGLLGALDTELDGTDARMVGARRRLARVARGAKDNGTWRVLRSE